MPTEMLTKDERRPAQPLPRSAVWTETDELRAAARRQRTRERRLQLNVAAWALGTILLTTLWVINEWQANGAFERFGHGGNPGDWSPTLWALAVGIWGLIVGIMALRVHFERPVTETNVARERLERIGRLKFHAAAWALGMLVLTPLLTLIEWQDNGRFERFSNDSQPGEWDPTGLLAVGGIWGIVVAILALQVYRDRPRPEPMLDR